MNKLRVVEVCAGIGGIALGFEMAGGFDHVAFVERDDYACKILKKHWPQVPQYRDIRDVSAWNLPPCDVLAGGIPCQPHSLAGKRGASSDDRDLWPEFFRLICEIRPRYAVVENVPGLRSSDRGLFFGRILRDLATIGYDAEWVSLSAADVGAPHERERVWIVSYPNRLRRAGREHQQEPVSRRCGSIFSGANGNGEQMANPAGRRERQYPTSREQEGAQHQPIKPSWWAVEPRLGRVAHGVPRRVDRLRCLGNGVVPECAAVIAGFIRRHYEANL